MGTERRTQTAVVALGSNVGDRRRHIESALENLQRLGRVLSVSGLYETAPMYVQEQDPFLNAVALLETDLEPTTLLTALKAAESVQGRLQRGRNQPREIDLDLIAIDERVGEFEGLVLPHPRAHERRFVLEPLNEIAPGFVLPGYGAVSDLLQNSNVQSQEARRILDAPILLPRD